MFYNLHGQTAARMPFWALDPAVLGTGLDPRAPDRGPIGGHSGFNRYTWRRVGPPMEVRGPSNGGARMHQNAMRMQLESS